MERIRLTMAQALVKFLDNQYINYNGERLNTLKECLVFSDMAVS